VKLFDRYIILSFLRNYLLSFVVLVGLYIALDMVFHFDELTRSVLENSDKARGGSSGTSVLKVLLDIAGFYSYQPLLFFVHLSGIIPVAAAAFTLMRMTRMNELTAMLAAGVPMLRIAAPVIFVGICLSALLVVDQELIIPRLAPQLSRQHDEVGQVRGKTFPINSMEDRAGSILVAQKYLPPGIDNKGKHIPATMDRVDIIEKEGKQAVAHIQAASATYDGKVWIFHDGKRQTGGIRPLDPVTVKPIGEWKTDIGPEEIALYRNAAIVDLLSTSQINGLLQHPRNYGTVPLLRVKHSRFVQPLANIILLLLAIPCVLTREPGSLKMAVTRTVLLTGACMGSFFLSHQLAGRPPAGFSITLWPALILWLPIFIFGPLAVWQMDRVKT
jgi:lipopolysaccharide export system permease protein